MTLYELPRPACDVDSPREPWPGEGAALAQVATTGRRAADWLRSLGGAIADGELATMCAVMDSAMRIAGSPSGE
ncbi:hypothetical protein [Streptomyces sp. NRRL S-1022]|uniref:hypothetical protein n=1 Tax=Streptomyces sp. NRRL S-1022 TaxID=1463880 RepID=UPI0004C13045|nr:hypothetical protein [Streptomyces sp. NRRL S-1022]